MKQKIKNKQKIVPLAKDNYLIFIENSIGAKSFKNFFALMDGKRKDLLRDGDLSCAYFVSSVLKIFGLIKDIHLTVSGTIHDMEKSGWIKIKLPKPGSVILWEKQKFGQEEHSHIGFYLKDKEAVSNYFVKHGVKRTPVKHSLTFGNKRKIEGIWWNKKLENKRGGK